MKSRILRLVCLQMILFLFAFLGSGQGQGCSGWMTPSYSSYTNITSDSSSSHIYTSVLVDGSSYGTCPFGCGCSSVYHTPQAYNKLASVGGWATGTRGPWNSYISEQNNQNIAATPGVLYYFTSNTQVTCTSAGILYTSGYFYFGALIAWTKVKHVSGTGGNCSVTPICSNNVTPACPITHVTDTDKVCHPAYNCESLAYRLTSSHPYECYINVCQGTSNTAPGNCTPWQ